MPTPAGSDETAVDDATHPSMKDDLQEQQELIARLKAERDAAKAQLAASQSQRLAEEMLEEDETVSKRPREEDPKELRFNFKEPAEGEVAERAIATNRRVGLYARIPPERKSLAWGAIAFAAGMGAM